MTRINLVPPETLCRLHLIAEYRELPRIFALVRTAQFKGLTVEKHLLRAPKQYVLGPGHLFFFYTRLGFLKDRQVKLVAEMVRRGYAPANTTLPDWLDKLLHPSWFGNYEPTLEAIEINQCRIDKRLQEMGLTGVSTTF